MKSVLNVGSGMKGIAVPSYFDGWRQDRLDIDSSADPTIVMDARNLQQLPAATYDAVYCSHNLEHYYRFDGVKVLEGFAHVLKADGFAEIRVPDVQAVMVHAMENGLDLDDTLYTSPAGPILVRDVMYGYGVEIERFRNDFYSHKTGFSHKSLAKFVKVRGFRAFAVLSHNKFELTAYLFRSGPSAELWSMLNLDPAARPGG